MAIKGFEKQDPMAGLNQLMQMMNQMNTMNARKERSHLIMHEEIGQGLNKIYNNEQLATRKNHLDKYLQENRDNMDETTLSKFELLNSQFEIQQKSNDDYIKGMEFFKDIGEKTNNSLLSYSEIQSMSDEALNASYNKFFPDSKIDKTLEEKRNDLRLNAMQEVQSLVDSYSTFSGEFRGSHGERLGTAGFREDAAYISNLKEAITFGIVQAKDDYVLDTAESEAMLMGVQLGSYQPIQDYKTNESNRNRQIQSSQLKDLDEHYNTIVEYNDYINEAENFLSMKNDGKEGVDKQALRNQTWATIGEEEITYEMLEDEQGLGYLDSFIIEQDKAVQKFKNVDKSYNKREGVSYIDELTMEDNIKVLFEDKPQYTPDPPKDPIIEKEFESVSSELGIETIDIAKDVDTAKSWASPELKKTGEQLNQMKSDIDNFIVNESPEINTSKLNNLLNKESNNNINYNDLIKLEKSYNNDLKEMNKLYEEEQQMKKFGIKGNDERRVELRKKINNLYYKWNDSILQANKSPEIKGKPSPRSALGGLRMALNTLEIKKARYNKLKAKYDKDLSRSQK